MDPSKLATKERSSWSGRAADQAAAPRAPKAASPDRYQQRSCGRHQRGWL